MSTWDPTGARDEATGAGSDEGVERMAGSDTDADGVSDTTAGTLADTAGDAAADSRVESMDDGAAAVGTSQALPFVMTVREHFAALDDVALTGEARVDAATSRLTEVPDLPTSDHVEIYDDVHRRLQDALSDTEVR